MKEKYRNIERDLSEWKISAIALSTPMNLELGNPKYVKKG